MPGRDYTRAYALFEQSLGDSFLSQPYQNRDLHVVGLKTGEVPRAALSTQKEFEKLSVATRTKTPPTTRCRVRDLPPTPPSNTRSNKSPALTSGTLPPYHLHSTALTPGDYRRLPTPDTTPHESAEGLNAGGVGSFPTPSPYPESFRTALEEQWSPYLEANRSRYFSTQSLKSIPTLEASDIHRTPSNPRISTQNKMSIAKKSSDILPAKPPPSSLNSILINEQQKYTRLDQHAYNELDQDNVKNPPNMSSHEPNQFKTSPIIETSSFQNDEPIPLLMRGLSQRKDRLNKRRSPRSSLSAIIEQTSPPNASNSFRRDVDYKRHSGASNTSTVVQAYIFDSTPPPQKRTLRHSPKNVDLRETMSHNDILGLGIGIDGQTPTRTLLSNNTSPENRGDSDSIQFDDLTPTHILLHKNRHIPNKEERNSIKSESSLKSEPRSLVHKDQPLPSRQNRNSNESEHSTKATVHSLIHKDQQLPGRRDRSSVDSQMSAEFESMDSAGMGSRTANHLSSSPHINFTLVQSEYEEISEHNMDHREPLGFVHESTSRYRIAHGRHGSADNASIDTAETHRPSDDRSASCLQALSVLSHRGKAASPGSFPHPDLGSTPLSFQSEALSVNEATAVNIYPHNNGSLLVVEHSPTMNPLSQNPVKLSSVSERFPLIRHSISIELRNADFSSPPTITVNTNDKILSELAPPTFSIIPPTPSDIGNLDEPVAIIETSQSSALPTRRTSMLKRARQYSDSIFQPLITFTATNTGSLRRSITVRKYYWTKRRRASASKNGDLVDKDGNLHAFWQPRAFWEGISSDGSHDDEDTAHEGADEHDRLPAGGDTSNVETPQTTPTLPSNSLPAFSKWRISSRGGSFRGFLIGNSLGIERGPTNRRRHVVRWPTGRQKRRIAGEMGGSGPTTMQVDGPKSSVGSSANLGNQSSALLKRVDLGMGSATERKGLMHGWRKRITGAGLKW